MTSKTRSRLGLSMMGLLLAGVGCGSLFGPSTARVEISVRRRDRPSVNMGEVLRDAEAILANSRFREEVEQGAAAHRITLPYNWYKSVLLDAKPEEMLLRVHATMKSEKDAKNFVVLVAERMMDYLREKRPYSVQQQGWVH